MTSKWKSPKESITWLTYPDPMPGKTYRTTIWKDKKEIGAIVFNSWPMEAESKIITGQPKKKQIVAVLHIIGINVLHRNEGIAYKVLREWLKGFDRVDTRVDSKEGRALIVKAGFKTGDYINYIWEKEEKPKE